MHMTKPWLLKGMGLLVVLTLPLSLSAQEAGKPAPENAKPSAADSVALLKAIPADASAFVALRNLKQLDKDVQDSVKALNLPAGVIPSLSKLVKDDLRLSKGFNENGGVALVVLNASQVKQAEELEKRIALFFSATDPKAMADAMGAEGEGEVKKVELFGEPAWGAARGDFLVVAKDEATLKEAIQARGDGVIKTLSAERAKAFAEQDIFGWASFRGISKELRESVRDIITKETGQGIPLEALGANLDQMEKFIEDGQDVSFGLSLDPKRGITGSFYFSMRPDTEYGRQIAAIKPLNGSLLASLPADPFVVAAGAVSNPDTERQLKKFLDLAFSEENVGDRVDKDKLAQVRDGLASLLGGVQQMSLGIYPLPIEDGQGMVNAVLIAKVKDAAQWKQEARKIFNMGKELGVEAAKKSGEPEEEVSKTANAIQWKEGAEKLGGADVDQLVVDLAQLPNSDTDTVDQIKKVLGPEGVLVRVGALGKDQILVVFGGGAKRFEAAAKIATAKEAPLAGNADIKKVADRLQAGPRVMEIYFNVDKLISLAMDISSEVGGGIMFPIALRNAAPIAMTSVKIGETAQQTELLVPMELLRSLADIFGPMLQMGLDGPQPGDSDEPELPSDESGLQ